MNMWWFVWFMAIKVKAICFKSENSWHFLPLKYTLLIAYYCQPLQNVEIIMQEWIETAQELGREIPTPKIRLILA